MLPDSHVMIEVQGAAIIRFLRIIMWSLKDTLWLGVYMEREVLIRCAGRSKYDIAESVVTSPGLVIPSGVRNICQRSCRLPDGTKPSILIKLIGARQKMIDRRSAPGFPQLLKKSLKFRSVSRSWKNHWISWQVLEICKNGKKRNKHWILHQLLMEHHWILK